MKILRILIYLLVIVNFILIGFLISEYKSFESYSIEKANLSRVIDGDTIETDLGKVRFLGINTPEKNMGGFEEAKNYLEQFIGKKVELLRETEDKDIYGRLLRYVFYNDKLINEDILKRGLAHYYSYSEDDFTNRLKKAEETARKNQIGIWEKSKDKCSECIVLKELNEIDPGEYLILENICGFNCDLNLWTIKDDATHTKKLDFEINAKQEKKIDYEGRIWNDDGDSLYLRDENGLLVLFWRY